MKFETITKEHKVWTEKSDGKKRQCVEMKFHLESVVRSGHPREFRVLSELLHQRQ